MSKHTPRGLKAKLFAQARKFIATPCRWCGALVTIDTATVDHDPPLAFPGSHPERAVLACRRCNELRGYITNALLKEIGRLK